MLYPQSVVVVVEVVGARYTHFMLYSQSVVVEVVGARYTELQKA